MADLDWTCLLAVGPSVLGCIRGSSRGYVFVEVIRVNLGASKARSGVDFSHRLYTFLSFCLSEYFFEVFDSVLFFSADSVANAAVFDSEGSVAAWAEWIGTV